MKQKIFVDNCNAYKMLIDSSKIDALATHEMENGLQSVEFSELLFLSSLISKLLKMHFCQVHATAKSLLFSIAYFALIIKVR